MVTNRAGILASEPQEVPATAAVGAARAVGIGTISERLGFEGLSSSSPPAHGAADRPYQHPLTDRRRATRVHRKFVAQMTPWAPGRPSIPFEVIIDDISETGVGLIHHQPLEIGLRHLLTVPRGDDKTATLEYLVSRCTPRPDGNYSIGLELAGDVGASPADLPPRKRVTSRTTKILFLLFGIFGLIIAAFAPL